MESLHSSLMTIPRLASDAPLTEGATIALSAAQLHYLQHVLRLAAGDKLHLFHGESGEYRAVITGLSKREATLTVGAQLRPPHLSPDFWVCFAPVKAGRTESILEKVTELGARVICPVLTKRSVVDKLNLDRASATVREAAEQCERLDIPEIRPMIPLPQLLADWPPERALFYGDESGDSPPFDANMLGGITRAACLVGPEGGFTAEEFAQIRHVKSARGVSLGPRILRSDTASIILSALILASLGDWHDRPRFRPAE
jgi:16S rRNA (uracil1498-N3)-methyltransferase